MRNIVLAFSLLIGFQLFSQVTEIGLASFYADKFDGRVTASGEIFRQNKMTAAHRTLPFGSTVKVTNMENNKSVKVMINDRGPFVKNRVIDLSRKAAKELGFVKKGVVRVKVEVVKIETDPATTSKKPTPVKNKKKQSSSASYSGSTDSSSLVEYYEVKSSYSEPSGFGIQIASYKEAANLMKRCSEIEKSVDKQIFVQVSKVGNSKVYRIMLGTFSSRKAAQSYNDKLRGKFSGSFVKEF